MNLFKPVFSLFVIFVLASCGVFKPKQKPKEANNEMIELVRLRFESVFFQAQRERALGNHKEALAHYQEALSINPKSDVAYYDIAGIYLALKSKYAAYENMLKAVALNEKNHFYWERLALICLEIGKPEEGAKAWERVCRLKSKDPEPCLNAAQAWMVAKNPKLAIEIVNEVEKRFGVGEETIRLKEQLYLEMGKPEKAIAELQKLIAQYPSEIRFKGMLAELYMSIGKFDDAATIYRQIVVTDPGNGFAHYGLAEYHRLKQNKNEMLSELRMAFMDANIPAQNKLNVLFSLIPLIDGDLEMKQPIFLLAEAIRETHPDEAAGHAVMGDLLFADGKKILAQRAYEDALDINPANFNIWRQYLSLIEESGEYKKLQRKSEEALAYFPVQTIFYYFSAISSMQLKQYAEVITACKSGIGNAANDDELKPILYSLMGDALQKVGTTDQVIEAYENALKLKPSDPYTLNNYAFYLAEQGKELEKALKMSELSMKRSQPNASYLDTYGWILFKLGRYKEAIVYLEDAYREAGNQFEILDHLGDAYYRAGDLEKAKHFWRKALETDQTNQTTKNKLEGKARP